jgi:predicted nucleotidyltransferase component of viral defense system
MLSIEQIESFYPENLRIYKRNLLREYLQYVILEIIYRSDYGRYLIFMGGTAIHIIHGSQRFSEDLDFDNKGLKKEDFWTYQRWCFKN